MKKILSIILIVSFTVCMTFVGYGCKVAEEEAPVEEVAEEEAPVEEVAEDAYDPKEHPIGLTIYLKSHPVIAIMIAGFMARAAELGYEPHLLAPDEADAPKMYGLMEAGIEQFNIEGICMVLWDVGAGQYTQELADKGIKVVTAHIEITPEMKDNYPGLLAWAGPSCVEYGKAAARAIGEQIGGKGTVAVTSGSFNDVELASGAAFTEEMNASYPDVKVLEPIEEGFDTPTAIQRATAIMQANPDIVGAYSTTGAGPSTWAGAQEATGKKIVAIAMDYSRVNLDLVNSGMMYGIVAQPLYQEFAMGAELLDKLLRGDTVSYDNLMDAPIVTKENIDEYYELLDKVEEVMKGI